MDLAQLFNHYGSDKDRNGYSNLYHILFDKLKDSTTSMLEIGIGTMIPGVWSSMVGYSLPGYSPGGSLRAWRDYFYNAQIVGVDVQPDTQFTDERIRTFLCDSMDKKEVDALMKPLGLFDIILDDGLHTDVAQLSTLNNFYDYLKEGGIYIIEDIVGTSVLPHKPHLIAELCNGDPFFFSGKNNICVIYKKPLHHEVSAY